MNVQQVIFSGDQSQISPFELQALVSDAIGSELDLPGLQALSHRVTDHFKAQGWILTRAYLPQQDVTEGIITIAIMPGIVSTSNPVNVTSLATDNQRQDTQLIAAMASAQIQPGQPLQEADLNRAVLLINDLPGISATSHLQPGNEQGSTKVNIELQESEVNSAMAWIDNHGSPSTGKYQANLNYQWHNPTGNSDQAGFLLMANEGSKTGQVSYSLPYGLEGTRFQASYSTMNYKVITGAGLSSNVKGFANTAKLNWRAPLERSYIYNSNLSVNTEHPVF